MPCSQWARWLMWLRGAAEDRATAFATSPVSLWSVAWGSHCLQDHDLP